MALLLSRMFDVIDMARFVDEIAVKNVDVIDDADVVDNI